MYFDRGLIDNEPLTLPLTRSGRGCGVWLKNPEMSSSLASRLPEGLSGGRPSEFSVEAMF